MHTWRIFNHPSQVCMSYLEHFQFSMNLSLQFAYASFAAMVHAFFPDIYVTHSTDTLNRIQKQMKDVGCR